MLSIVLYKSIKIAIIYIIHGTAGAKSDKIEYLWWQDKGNIFVRQTLYQIPLLCNKKYNYHEITNKYCLI